MYEVCRPKCPTYLHISPPRVLFHVIWFMVCLKVVPIWLNNKLMTLFFSLLKVVLVLAVRYRLQSLCRISFNRLYIVKSMSFKQHFKSGNQPKVSGSYARSVHEDWQNCMTSCLAKYCYTRLNACIGALSLWSS